MMAERFWTSDGHPETATAALCLVRRRSRGRQHNRHTIGFRPGIGRASTGYLGGGLPGIACHPARSGDRYAVDVIGV